MGKGLHDWNGFVPDDVQTEPAPLPTRRSLRFPPRDGKAVVIELEWDDGNGMWITPGVSL